MRACPRVVTGESGRRGVTGEVNSASRWMWWLVNLPGGSTGVGNFEVVLRLCRPFGNVRSRWGGIYY
jgi:hypothetical protein